MTQEKVLEILEKIEEAIRQYKEGATYAHEMAGAIIYHASIIYENSPENPF